MNIDVGKGNDGLCGEARQTVVSKLFPTAFQNVHAHAAHQVQIKVQIVNGVKPGRKHFTLQKQMAEIGPRVVLACVTGTFGIEG